MTSRAFPLAALALWITASNPDAWAFQIESSLTAPCHEGLTLDATRAIDWPPSGAEAIQTDVDDERLLSDLPFSLDGDERRLLNAALLFGVRDNDVEGEDPSDFAALARIHNAPEKQVRHCLRDENDDGPEGDATAVAACRQFILDEIRAGIGSGATIDFDAREEVDVFLVFRGDIDIDLPRHAYRVGRAVHALQDSYTHAFRNPDDGRIRHVLNWIEGNVGDSYDVARDGHAHSTALDDCDSGNRVVDDREISARAATRELLDAVYAPASNTDEIMARVEVVLDRYMELEPGCTYDDAWCDAEELGVTGGCQTGGSSSAWGLLLALAGGMLLIRRRSRGGLAVLLVTLGTTGSAAAQPIDSGEEAAEAEAKVEQQEQLIDRLPDPIRDRFGITVAAGGSIDRGAAAFAAGIRVNPWERVGLGFEVEYNPWVSLSSAELAHGTVNFVVPVELVWTRFGAWTLASGVGVGASVLLTELVGADRGSIGVYGRLTPLQTAFPIGGSARMVLRPLEVALPTPQLSGIPFYYSQYRFSAAIEWY